MTRKLVITARVADLHDWRSVITFQEVRPSWMICALARWKADHMRACVDVIRACVAKGHEQAAQPRSLA